MNHFGQARCEIPGCGHVSVFTVSLDTTELRRIMPRLMANADWLYADGCWCCPYCSQALRDSVGKLSPERSSRIRQAIAEALYMRRMEVTNGG